MQHTVYAAGASKAVDVAIKPARRFTGRRRIVAIATGYHGRTGCVRAIFAGHDRPVLQLKPGLLVDRADCDEALTRSEAALRVASRQR